MKPRTIGRLSVSVIGLGCNNFGRSLDARKTAAVVDAALDAGIVFFDTSDNYGDGRSEDFLARALGDRRDEVVIATKFGMPVAGFPGSGGAAPGYVERAVDRSLRRLRTDRIDLYQLHTPDPGTPIEDTLGALDGLVRAGKVLEIGCSNLTADQVTAAAAAARRRGTAPFVTHQVEYSLLHRDPEHDGVLDACPREGMTLIPYFPLAAGLRGSTPPPASPLASWPVHLVLGRLAQQHLAHLGGRFAL
ncbi:MAG: aldo/keto reductase [Acidimicrobiales bacterium]